MSRKTQKLVARHTESVAQTVNGLRAFYGINQALDGRTFVPPEALEKGAQALVKALGKPASKINPFKLNAAAANAWIAIENYLRNFTDEEPHMASTPKLTTPKIKPPKIPAGRKMAGLLGSKPTRKKGY